MDVMINAYKDFWANFANFSGRTSRSGYWYVVLCNIIIGFVLGFLAGMVDFLSILSGLYSLASLIPGIAICIRRLHDIDKSGWFYLLGLIPVVGSIILIVLFCKAGNPEANQYGEAA